MHRLVLIFALSAVQLLSGAEDATKLAGQFHLSIRDLVRVNVQGEPSVSVDRRIDGLGQINVPLIGAVKVSGLTIDEAQQLITRRYVQDEIFIHPEVVLIMLDYAPKEVMILGQIGKQGKVPFPPETSTLSIVDAITSAGGLTRISNGSSVRVTRHDEQGHEQDFTVNVEKMIEGRGPKDETFLLQSGDVVFVPERVF